MTLDQATIFCSTKPGNTHVWGLLNFGSPTISLESWLEHDQSPTSSTGMVETEQQSSDSAVPPHFWSQVPVL